VAVPMSKPAAAIIVHEPSTSIVVHEEPHERAPHRAYLRSLSTEASRQSMAGALARVTRSYFKCEPDAFRWETLDFETMDALRTKLAEDFGVRTARHALSALRGVLRYAVRLKVISREQYADAIDLKPLKGLDPEVGRALSKEELERVRDHCTGLPGAYGKLVSGVVLGALLGAGVRAQEAAALSLDAYHDGVLVVPGKGLKTRTVPVHSSMRGYLTRWIAHRKGRAPTLFLRVQPDGTVEDEPLSRWLVWKIVRDVRTATDVKMSPHDCRRTFATEYIRRSGDIGAVQKLLGHAKPETTMRYDKRGEDELARFVEKYGG
jgi:integrase/recombinase XerD